MLRRGLGLAAAVAAADQATKWAAYTGLTGLAFWDPAPDPLPRVAGVEVTPFFNLVTVWNFGVSFGMFNRGSDEAAWVFALIAAAITAVLVTVALGSVIGGAVGNVIDRLRFGAVFDFLDVHAAGWHWPAFNVADAAIAVGVGLLLLDALFAPKPSTK
jgi:signal peptidase II